MTMDCLHPATNGKFEDQIHSAREFNSTMKEALEVLGCCHSIIPSKVKIGKQSLTGDSMEIKMFEFSRFSFADDSVDTFNSIEHGNIKVHHAYQFNSDLQRMSVIVEKKQNGHLMVLTKGAPEKLQGLCLPASLPNDFQDKLNFYSENGFRVLALASKPIEKLPETPETERDKMEFNMGFVGFAIFRNQLKEASKPTINKLRSANVSTKMCTGDNLATAIAMAKQCSIVTGERKVLCLDVEKPGTEKAELRFFLKDSFVKSHNSREQELAPIKDTGFIGSVVSGGNKLQSAFIQESLTFMQNEEYSETSLAMTGSAFEMLFSDKLEKEILSVTDLEMLSLLRKACVFARMTPGQKAHVVKLLQSIGHTVAMVGDGANDMCALKQADTGLSLSIAEASIAAPFTSRSCNIGPVDLLLREGQCTLANNYTCFKFLMIYSWVQCCATIGSSLYGDMLSNYQYFYQDMFIVTPLFSLLPLTRPASVLSVFRPSDSLICTQFLTSLFFQASVLSLILLTLCIYATQLGFEERIGEYSTMLFLISNLFYFGSLLAFNAGRPFRQESYRNILFTLVFLLFLGYSLAILVSPEVSLSIFESQDAFYSTEMKFALVPVSLAVSILLVAFERLVVNGVLQKRHTEMDTTKRLIGDFKDYLN